MKILHICLASFFIDNHSYQENLLPKYHKKMGYDVEVVASLFNFDENGEGFFETGRREYINENQIPVTRLEYKRGFWNKKLRQYIGTYEAVEKANPDIIFVHGCQFLDIQAVVGYLEENPQVRVYVDNHADFSNSATNWLSKNILHKIIWKKCAQLIEPYTTKFYGVLPARVDFLQNVYNLPEEKTELLVMGTDDDKVNSANNLLNKSDLRKKYNINQDEFLIITGGKIDNAKKQTLLLMEAVKSISNMKIKLIVFGSVIPELKEEFMSLVDGKKVQYVGWIESSDSYQYFASADLAVFPGGHSVLWEQVVAQGLPLVVNQGENMSHIDFDGNIKFLQENTYEEIYDLLLEIVSDKRLYKKMKKASQKNRKHFWYSNIARKSLELDVEYHD